jgi:hypothetical protein
MGARCAPAPRFQHDAMVAIGGVAWMGAPPIIAREPLTIARQQTVAITPTASDYNVRVIQ